MDVYGEYEIYLPDGLTAIEAEVFANIDATSVHITDGVTSIGDGAFRNNAQLLMVDIPPSLTEFGDDVFAGCPNLVLGGQPGSAAETYAREHHITWMVL